MFGEDQLELNMINYEWLEKTTNPKLLKKALKLLKDDGNYFPDLSRAIDEKLQSVDEKYKKKKQNENISQEDYLKSREELFNFENELKANDILLNTTKSSSTAHNEEVVKLMRKKEAENEKIKGNELMKTKEYDEAIRYYTNSIKIDEYEPTTYCNRALAYIKNKQYYKGLDDCDKAIALKNDYIKAYYRRSICLTNLKKFDEALDDILFVLSDNPQNKELNNQLNELKTNWKTYEKEDWEKKESDIEGRIKCALEGGKYERKVEEPPEGEKGIKINIVEEEIDEKKVQAHPEPLPEKKEEKKEEKPKEEKPKEEPKEEPKKEEKNVNTGFKKIKIVEEDD